MMFILILWIYGLNWMKVVEKDMTRNCLRDDLDLTAGNVCPVIELLTTTTYFLHIVSILVLLTRLKMHECAVRTEIRSCRVLSLLW